MSSERHTGNRRKAADLLVYLVEDDEAVLLACSQAMMLADITVRSFRSAELALASFDDLPPAVIVSDVRMSGMSGLALLDEIQKRVCEHYRIRTAEMVSARRAREVARPRQVAMYLAKQLTSRSLPEIGRKFGGRDHTTVMHAYTRVSDDMQEKPEIYNYVTELTARLKQRGNE